MRPRHRLSQSLLIGVLAVAPLTLLAQGGMGGFGGGGFGRGGRGGMGGAGGRGQGTGMRREDPPINTVDLILKRGHDLALTDSQVVQITAVKARQDSSVAALRARLDSLAPGSRGGDLGEPEEQGGAGPGSQSDDARRDRMRARQDAMKGYRDALKQGRDAALAVLEKKQRKQAEKLEGQLKKELESEAPQGAPNGQGGGFGRGRRGGAEVPVSTSVVVPAISLPRR